MERVMERVREWVSIGRSMGERERYAGSVTAHSVRVNPSVCVCVYVHPCSIHSFIAAV